MTDPLAMTRMIDTPQRLVELLNIAHQRPFSLLFANYSWLLGAAGGITLLWVIDAWRGRPNEPADRLAMPMVVVLVLAGFLNVLAEVQQPSRLLYGYLFGWIYWDTAIIKYGIILLPLLLMLAWWSMFQSLDRAALDRAIRRLSPPLQPLGDFFSLWSRHFRLCQRPRLYRALLVILFGLGLFAPLYSGVFLMNEHGIPIWNSPAQPLIFLATGVAMGAVLLTWFAPLLYRLTTGERAAIRMDLYGYAAVGIALSAIVWAGWIWWISRFGTIAELRAADLFLGPYRTAIFWNWWRAGIALPLAIFMTPLRSRGWARCVAALGILWGGYAVRLIVVIGGQALNRSGAGYLAFSPAEHVLWYTGASLLFLLGFLALLLLLLPLDGRAPPVTTS